MKSAFIAGFVKAAADQGLEDETIARIFKRAMANPQVAGMFKGMPEQGAPVAPDKLQALSSMQRLMQQNPQNAAILQQLLAQGQQPI